MMLAKFILSGADGGAAVSIDLGDNAYSSLDEDGQTTTGAFFVNSDGSVGYTGDFLGTNESGQQVINPTGDGTGFYIRITNTGGTDQRSGGISYNVWYELTALRVMNFSKASSGGPDATVGTYLLEVGTDGSTADDSQSFTVTLTEQSP